MKRANHLLGFGREHKEETSPDFGGWEDSQGEARHDAEVVAAAFEDSPEAVVLTLGRRHYLAGSQHDAVGEDVVADESYSWAEERVATWDCSH